MWSVGVQRQLPWKIVLDVNYVGRRAGTCSASATSTSWQPGSCSHPGVNIAALPVQRLRRAARYSENSGRSEYHTTAADHGERRYANGFKLSRRLHVRPSRTTTASDKRNVLWNSYDERQLLGAVELPTGDATPLVVSYIWTCRSSVTRDAAGQHPGRVARSSRSTFVQSGQPFLDSPGPTTRRRGPKAATAAGRPRWRTSMRTRMAVLSRQRQGRQLRVHPAAFARPPQGRFGNFDAEHHPATPRPAVEHRALQELRAEGSHRSSSPARDVQLHQPSET